MSMTDIFRNNVCGKQITPLMYTTLKLIVLPLAICVHKNKTYYISISYIDILKLIVHFIFLEHIKSNTAGPSDARAQGSVFFFV